MSISSTYTINVSENTSLLNVNMMNMTKLTSTKFMMWNRQVHALLDGYDLAGYLDGSIIVPATIITTNGVVATNPAFTYWKRQDKLIYSALLGAISVIVQPILSTTTTSAEIWSTHASTYVKPTRGHVKQIKQQIEHWTKGTKTMDEYVQGFITRFNQLTLLGKPIDHEDQIDFIIGGLPEEYKTLADQIKSRDTAPSIAEIHEKLINLELKIQTQTAAVAVSITANAAYTRQGGNTNRGKNRSTPRNNQPWQQNQSFQYKTTQNQGACRGYQGRCQYCGVHGHSARRCPQIHSGGSQQHSSTTPWQPHANLASIPQYNAENWILDSSTTLH